MGSPTLAGRVPRELEAAARSAAPELEHAPSAVLIRAGLAALAGLPVREAVRAARGGQRGRARLPVWPPVGTAP